MDWHWLAVIMFFAFFGFLLTGYPVSFTFAGTALLFGLIGLGFGIFTPDLLRALPSRWFGTMSDFTLLAIPYFVFLGAVLEKSGIAEELLETIGILFGTVRGGIALAIVVVGTLLAATTGVVAASIIAMGLISLPIMLRYGYDKQLAAGVICASGTLAQLIPPSLVLVVLSDQIGVPIADLFVGAIVPGLMLAGAYIIYCLVLAYAKPGTAPALPPETRAMSGTALFLRVLRAMVPPLVLVLLILGSIFGGFATPTEAGAVGAVGALALAAANRRLNWMLVRDAANSTAKTTALVIIILFASTLFSLVFEGLGGSALMTGLLSSIPGERIGFVIFANIIIFLLGIFLEFIEISFIALPLLIPAARAIGFSNAELVWFGIVIAINLQTAFISPPVGFSLFYLQSVAPPEVKSIDINRGVIPFMAIQVVVLLLVIIFPQTVLWLVQQSAG
jgi:tripartite ATP-independent transporter DctM subunit